MPTGSGNLILREGLMRIFGSLAEARAIYINAPAGFGKTVAAQQWLNSINHAKAIVSLDEYDNSLPHFCEHVCAALLACQPQNNALAEIAAHPAFLSAPPEFTLRAIAALSGQKPTIFVLDDLHLIHDENVLHLLLVFIKRLPQNFQVLLMSRHDLPAGFADLWIRGDLAKITAEQLRFSKEEIARLYKKRGNPITPQQADDIYHHTAGWAIGVNALLLSGKEPADERIDYLDAFIYANVWEKWDEPIREFMLNTCAARLLNPQLCNVMANVENSDDILRDLTRQGAFIFQRPDGHYHYHQLFQNFLQHILKKRGQKHVQNLLAKEGDWYFQQRNFYNALDCYMACGNYEGIAECFKMLVNTGHEYFLIEKLLGIAQIFMIDKAAENFPYIYAILAWAAFNEGRAADMARYADLYYQHHPQIARMDPRLQLNIAFIRLIDFRISLVGLMQIFYSECAFASAVKDLGGIGANLGTINQNMPLLHKGTRDFSEGAAGNAEVNIGNLQNSIGSLFGETAPLLAECLMAGLLYEQGLVQEAYGHALKANVQLNSASSPESKFFTKSMLIYVLDALGEQKQAEQGLISIRELIETNGAYYLNGNFNALITRRKLAEGQMSAAWEWLDKHNTEIFGSPSFFTMYITGTTCRAYITVGNYDLAIILLSKLLDLATAYNRPLDIIETQILLAISYWKKKRSFQREALRCLEAAVTLAYGFGYTQLFINEGAELVGMLLRLQKSLEQRGDEASVPASFIKMLYLKIQESPWVGLTSEQPEQPQKYTEKQKAVMKLLCEGKSYREIAQAMGIKLPTLRSHISLIYKKLDVTNTVGAVKKIRQLGLTEEAQTT